MELFNVLQICKAKWLHNFWTKLTTVRTLWQQQQKSKSFLNGNDHESSNKSGWEVDVIVVGCRVTVFAKYRPKTIRPKFIKPIPSKYHTFSWSTLKGTAVIR